MKEIFIFILAMISIGVKAQFKRDTIQSPYTIIGKVLNAEDRKPVEFATVILLTHDSTVVKSMLTGTDGVFKFDNVLVDNCLVKVSFVGYSSTVAKLLAASKINGLLDVGEILLHYSNRQLNDVVILSHAPTIEQKIDRLVFNVENALTAIGGDALDALRVTPGVNIEDNQIRLIGKSSVIIMIDDRKVQLSGENLISFLSTLKAGDIKNIEVITNPPARYDAEGNSGIVNITLKKTKINSWNAGTQSTYTQNTYANGTVGGSFAYNKNKLSIVFNTNYINGSRNRTESDRIYYPDQFWNTAFKKRIYSKVLGLRTGLDYQLSKSWSMGILYIGGFNKSTIDEKDIGQITNNITSYTDSLIRTVAQATRHSNSNSLNWHSDIKLDTLGKLLTFNFDYFNFSNNAYRNFNTEMLFPDQKPTPGGRLSTDNIGKQDVSNYSFKADIDVPGKWVNISMGGRISYTQTNNYLDYFNTSSSGTSTIDHQTDRFKYNENTQALYLSANKTINKKWQFQVGLRTENTNTKGNSVTINQVTNVNYLQFFPTFYTSYKANDAGSFSFNYGRRIERPGFADLNPFKFYSSTYSYSTGNPFLQPQYSNVFELKYGYKNMLYTTLFYLNETHGFGSVPFVNDLTKVQYFMDVNYYTYNSFGISEYYLFDVIKWWESNNEINVYHNQSSFYSAVNLNGTKGWGVSFSTNNSFTLNKANSLKAGINYRYQSDVYDLLYKRGAHSSMDIALKYTLLKNNLQLSLIAQDILKKDISNKVTYNNQIKQIYDYYNDNRLIRLSVSYKLGNAKLKTKSRSVGNEEEKGRVN